MKKLAIISIISMFLLVGCDWFQAPAETLLETDPVVEDTVVEEDPVLEEEDLILEDAAADSESKEVILAKCLTENGAKLYTASWCGHCQTQKEAFKDGLEYIDHTECAEDGDWAQACKDADVTSVPTWNFADGSVKTGNTPLAILAEAAGCTY